MKSIPPILQERMIDLLNGGIFLFQFDDGSQLDSCGNLGYNTISAQLELAPGEVVAPSAQPPIPIVAEANVGKNASAATVPPVQQECPASITGASSGVSFLHMIAEALTTSEFERQVDATMHNGQSKHYLDIRVLNNSDKPISAFEFGASYLNRMGDETTSVTYVSPNTSSIKPHEEFKSSAMDRGQSSQTGAGQIKLYISRVRFEDGTLWQDNGTKSCFKLTNIG